MNKILSLLTKKHRRATLSISFGIFLSFLLFTMNVSARDNDNTINDIAHKYGIDTYSITYIDNGADTTISNGTEPIVFEAGSLSKPVAAYICMELVQQGRLSLDDTIDQYLDADWLINDNQFNSITVRQLLAHTAGFSPSYEMGIDKTLYFTPGSHFSYSGVGYIYLQRVIEKVYDASLEQAAREFVFAPLQMENSTFANASTVTPYVRTSSLVIYIVAIWCVVSAVLFLLGLLIGAITKFRFYQKKTLLYICIAAGFIVEVLLLALILPRMIIPALVFGAIGGLLLWITRKGKRISYAAFLSYIALAAVLGIALPVTLPVGPQLIDREENAAYTLKTTSGDMAAFLDTLLSLSHEEGDVKHAIFDSQIEIDSMSGWGLGLAIDQFNGANVYWHSGINPGMQSLFVINPQSDQAIVIMTNSDNGLSFARDIVRYQMGIDADWEITRTDLKQISQ